MRGKKLAAALLGAVLLLGTFPATAFAEEPPQQQQEQQEHQEAPQAQVPQIRVTTENGNGTTLEKADGYVNAKISITDPDGSVLEDDVSFKVRGNTTALSWVKKKAYTFKFAKKKELYGMGKGKKWVLLANTFDPTLIRNHMAFDTARELGITYTPGQKVTEVWVDGTFLGCYTLMTPVQEGKDRVDINIENGKDFMVELESINVEDDVTYFKEGGWRYAVKEPEEPDEEEAAYIQDTFASVVKTLKNGTEAEIRDAIDVESFAKFYTLNEYLKTFDFSMSSVFFYYKDGKLYAGPPWDYDISAGNANKDISARGKGTYEAEGLFCSDKNLYQLLCKKTWFNAEVKQVYEAHQAWFDNLGADDGYTDTFRKTYADVIERNFKDAGWNIGKWWINHQRKPEDNYEDNYQFLKDWCRRRSAWLDNYFAVKTFYRKGDADGNGVIDINDATVIQQMVAELDIPFDELAPLRASVTGKALSIDDATAVQYSAADLPDQYQVGEMQLFEKEDD